MNTLEDSLRYIAKLERTRRINRVDFNRLTNALRDFAQSADQEHFKRIVDAYISCAENDYSDDGPADVRGEPLAFLEWLCIGLDHSFTSVGLRSWKAGVAYERLPVGEIQTFFRE